MSESEKGSPPPEMELGGMAGALARALQDRSRVIQVSGIGKKTVIVSVW